MSRCLATIAVAMKHHIAEASFLFAPYGRQCAAEVHVGAAQPPDGGAAARVIDKATRLAESAHRGKRERRANGLRRVKRRAWRLRHCVF
jgi:hypothetical protein